MNTHRGRTSLPVEREPPIHIATKPRISNDNPYSEALFKTMKYSPKYPFNGFKSLEKAKAKHPERW